MSENVTNTSATASNQAIAPTIEIAAHAGTCYGVQRALDMALAAAPQAGECTQVHTLGPLIHNPIVVRELDEAGVGLADTLDDATSDRAEPRRGRGCHHPARAGAACDQHHLRRHE